MGVKDESEIKGYTDYPKGIHDSREKKQWPKMKKARKDENFYSQTGTG